MIVRFDIYNESIRDMMTPKSQDEISSVLKDKNDYKQFKIACEHGMMALLKKLLKEDEYDDILDVIHIGINVARRFGQSEIVDFLNKYEKSNEFQRVQMLNESIRDKMTPKEGALDKINQSLEQLATWLVEDKYFDTIKDAMGFVEWISENVEHMLGLGIELDEIYEQVVQFNMDEYLFSKGLPLKFAFQPKIKDDPVIVGSDAYNREHHMFYYETPETRKMREQRIEQLRSRLHLDESVRDKMTPKSKKDIKNTIRNTILSKKCNYDTANRLLKNKSMMKMFSKDEIRKLLHSPRISNKERLYLLTGNNFEIKKYFDNEHIKRIMSVVERPLDWLNLVFKYNLDDIYTEDEIKERINKLTPHENVYRYLNLKDKINSYTNLDESIRDKMTPISSDKIDKFINKSATRSPLLRAVEIGDVELAKIIIEKGVDIHEYNEVVLRTAAMLEESEMIKMLIENGANPEKAIKYHKLMYGDKYPDVIQQIKFHMKR